MPGSWHRLVLEPSSPSCGPAASSRPHASSYSPAQGRLSGGEASKAQPGPWEVSDIGGLGAGGGKVLVGWMRCRASTEGNKPDCGCNSLGFWLYCVKLSWVILEDEVMRGLRPCLGPRGGISCLPEMASPVSCLSQFLAPETKGKMHAGLRGRHLPGRRWAQNPLAQARRAGQGLQIKS